MPHINQFIKLIEILISITLKYWQTKLFKKKIFNANIITKDNQVHYSKLRKLRNLIM